MRTSLEARLQRLEGATSEPAIVLVRMRFVAAGTAPPREVHALPLAACVRFVWAPKGPACHGLAEYPLPPHPTNPKPAAADSFVALLQTLNRQPGAAVASLSTEHHDAQPEKH
jgi:hypothetical protein